MKEHNNNKSKSAQWNSQIERYLSKSDDLTVITLKGHLIVESILNSLIRAYCREPEHIEDSRLSFFQKMKIARAHIAGFDAVKIWDSIQSLNSLRNELAHILEPSDKLEKHIDQFLSLYYSQDVNYKHEITCFKAEKEIANEVRDAVSYLIGQLTVLDDINKIIVSSARTIMPRRPNLYGLKSKD